MRPRIYLDNNATTAIAPSVLQLLIDCYKHNIGNPSSVHSFGQQAKSSLIAARKAIASYFDVKPQELIFTSGGTEALNLVLRGLIDPKIGGHIVTSSVEHAAVYNSVRYLETIGFQATYLMPGSWGAVTLDAVREALRPDTRLITLMAVNNETGVKTDLESIAALAQEKGIPFVVDGVSWLGKEPITLPKGISAICFSAHKLHGPRGIGLAIVRSQFKLAPLIMGGGQEDQRRSGTENLPGILAFAEAISLLKDQANYTAHMKALQSRLEEGLKAHFPDLLINGDGPRICNVSNIAFPHLDGESMLMALDLDGIAVSHGSACTSGALEPSRALLSMGLSRERAASSLRFSLSRYTTEAEIDHTINAINK